MKIGELGRMKGKLRIIGYLLCFFVSINCNAELVRSLEEVTQFQLIAIMIEEGALEEANLMLDNLDSFEKINFDYFKLKAKLEEERGNDEKAIEFYKKASGKNKNDIFSKIAILKIKIKNKANVKEVKKEINNILALDLSSKEREDMEILAKAFEEKNKQKNYLLNISTGLVLTDNVYETNEDTESDIYIDTRLTLAGKKELNSEIFLIGFASFGNKSFIQETEESGNSIYLGVEPEKTFPTWTISLPLTYSFSTEDGEEVSTDYSIGLKAKKQILKEQILTTGFDVTNTDNSQSEYKGTSISAYTKLSLNLFYGITLIPELNFETTNYDDDSQNYNGIIGKLSGRKMLKDKYYLSAYYKVSSKDYDEDDREDLNHDLTLNVESTIGQSKWKYNVAYSTKMNDSNSSDNEYSVNTLSFKIKKEFN